MLKSVRYRNDAKLIFGIGLLLCALGCGTYGILLIPAVKGLKFEWEYIAIAVGLALVFTLVALYVYFLSCVWEARERKQQKLQDENSDCAVEEHHDGFGQVDSVVMIQIPQSVDCRAVAKTQASKDGQPVKVDMQKVKAIAVVAVPITAACIAVAALSSNAKYAKQAKRRKQFYSWMG